MAFEPRSTALLKQDGLGRVERVEVEAGTRVHRVATGGRVPGSALVARLLLARERRALRALAGFSGVPALAPEDAELAVPRRALVRTWIEGVPLWAAETLPEDFFERLEDLVRELHLRGVCHNDLHKEANVLVSPRGEPRVVDFQLASVHPRFGRTFERRAREDLRHVAKHHRRYLAEGGPVTHDPAAHLPRRRSLTAATWMHTVKPLYNLVTRRLLHTRDGEPRRPSGGPWPRWSPPLQPVRGRAGRSARTGVGPLAGG